MSDGLDLGQHGGPAIGLATVISGAVTAGLARFFRARDERAREEQQKDREAAMLVKLAKIEAELAQALRMLEAQSKLSERVAVLEYQHAEAKGLAERLALAERTAVAAHSRGDDFNRRLDRLEARQ